MEISFQGFRNAGVQKHVLYSSTGKRASLTIFNSELTNDFKGKDLDSFEKIFKKSVNKQNPNFLTLELWKYRKNPKNNDVRSAFFINEKEYKVSDETLGVFERVAKLLNKICKTPDEEFKVSKDYLESEDMAKNFILEKDMLEEDIVESMHSPECVKKVAGKLLEEITDEVETVLS